MAFDKLHFEKVLLEIQHHLEDTETSKLAHWHASSVYSRRHKYYLGLPATLISIILTWLLSTNIDWTRLSSSLSSMMPQIPMFFSLVVTVLSSLSTFLHFNELSRRHKETAEKLHSIWRECKNWSTDFPDESMCETAVHMVKQYRQRINEINYDAPPIPRWAWKSVSKQKKEGSTSYKIEEKHLAIST